MGIIRAQVRLPDQSGNADDTATNTTYWQTVSAVTEADTGVVFTAMDTFYNAVNEFLSPSIDPLNCRVFMYDMADPEPRPPIALPVLTVPSFGSSGLPQEVALCVSYRAEIVAGLDPRNRRGRFYLGPLSTQTMGGESGSTEGSRPNGAVIIDIVEAWAAAASTARDDDVEQVIYSPTLNQYVPAQLVWMDNEWDTQRRRGRQATFREQEPIYTP